jgi:hypothetical protein
MPATDKKILYIGNYRDGTGWGNAAVSNILAMDAAGLNVVPRAITYEAQTTDYPARIKQLEAQSSEGCDICVQHMLPHLFSYDSSYYNIGFVTTESYPVRDIGWHSHCNLMDEIWTMSFCSKGQLARSGVTKPIMVVPSSIDMSKYRDFKPTIEIKEMNDCFNFVFAGEWIERKNAAALVKAFHLEFGPNDPVNLVIKTSRTTADVVEKYCSQIKQGLKLRKDYRKEIIICGKIQEDQYKSILYASQCFVMPSRGESFCIPALEAMALGVPTIYTNGTGMNDFCYGQAVESREVPCFGAVDTLPHLDTARGNWMEIDVRQLQFALRSAFMKWNTSAMEHASKKAKDAAKEYDYAKIGQKIKEIIK